VASRYDDEIWSLVADTDTAAPEHLARFVAGIGSVGQALDLGCGDGRLSQHIDARALTLADVSSVALGRARRRVPEALAVELESDRPLPFEDNAFDLVLCAETIEHVRDVQLLLSEVRRTLRPGGQLALSTPAYGRMTGLAILARGFERQFDPLSPHLRFFTARSLRALLAEMGFELRSLQRASATLMALARR
jgi:SAM-dependent methyltransferase